MKTVTRLLVTVLLLLALPGALLAQEQGQTLTNADVVKLSKAGLGDDLITTKVQQASKVDFKLETDDIIHLKQAGVSQAVISAMLKRSSGPAPSAPASSDGFPAVSLVSTSGSTALKALEGDHKEFAAPFVGLKHFLVFDGKTATTRIKDRKPTLELHLDKHPGNHWWFVKLDPDNDDPTRGLDLQSAGRWGGAHTFEPDGDFIIASTVVDAGGGVYRFKAKSDLKPGEYALYCEKGYAYDFGVDK